MKRYRNILVGVDLAEHDYIVGHALQPPTREAVDRGLWLACETAAQLTFQAVLPAALDIPADAKHLVELEHLGAVLESTKAAANDALARLVAEADERHVLASAKLSYGKSWLELIRQAVAENHDLVIVGSRNLHGLHRFVVGSTGAKLLRKCPCPVWITKPLPHPTLNSIVVATDFTPVSQLAVDLAASLALLNGARLHIIHAVEYPLSGTFWRSQIPADALTEYRRGVYEHARQLLDNEMSRAPVAELGAAAESHLESDRADHAILQAIERHEADLLVMGTIGRGGIPGLLFGNTAERLVPQVGCSVLAVKPADFVCPIS